MAEQWRILVVESEENFNWNIVNSLQKDGYIVLGVTGGAEAIRTLWSEEYDVVICGQQMPDADGFDLLQWMRTYCPNSRMVMLGVSGSSVNRAQALELGVASYLEKPLDLHALKEELRRLLHSTGFSASLDSFDLLDVIQIINMSRKSIALVVNTGLEEQGTLRFQTGELVWAEYGILRGEEAFFALAAHKNGTVAHRPWNEHTDPNVTQPLSRLIFQALQYRSKYAEHQQLSSEVEAIRPGGFVPDPPTLPPLPDTLQDMEEDDTPFQFLEDDEEDDRPFQFVAEEVSVENTPVHSSFDQLMRSDSISARLEQVGGDLGMVKNTESGKAKQSSTGEKAWWEPTGSFPAFQMSGSMRAVTDEEFGKALPTPTNGSLNSMPPTTHKTVPAQHSTLPSWLTDQPTHQHLPVIRGSTGHTPALPKTPPAAVPIQPISPDPMQKRSAEWSTKPQIPLNPSESGLRGIDQEESMHTAPRSAIKPSVSNQPSGALRLSPTEWQSPMPLPLQGQTGQMSPVKPSSSQERPGDTLQSLAALKRANAASPNRQNGSAPGSQNTGVQGTSMLSKRNSPALSAALQTLGYSVPGFVAAAVISLDGMPIAQVAVDERDISPLCAHFGSVVQAALHILEQNHEEGYDHHTVIASRSQHILLRLIDKRKDVFQVLITTRETNPAESLDIMANVEAAIAAAL